MNKTDERDLAIWHDAEAHIPQHHTSELAFLLKSTINSRNDEKASSTIPKPTFSRASALSSSGKPKRSKSRQSSIPNRKAQPAKTPNNSLDLAKLDSIVASALAIPNLGQLNLLPIKCTQAVQRGVQYCEWFTSRRLWST